MGNEWLTREKLRAALDSTECGPTDYDMAIRAAAEAVLRIERASSEEVEDRIHRAEHPFTAFRDGQEHIFEQLGALAPKDQP